MSASRSGAQAPDSVRLWLERCVFLTGRGRQRKCWGRHEETARRLEIHEPRLSKILLVLVDLLLLLPAHKKTPTVWQHRMLGCGHKRRNYASDYKEIQGGWDEDAGSIQCWREWEKSRSGKCLYYFSALQCVRTHMTWHFGRFGTKRFDTERFDAISNLILEAIW